MEATLMEYIRQNHDAIPFLHMMQLSADQIKTRAEALQQRLAAAKHLRTEIVEGESLVGGGSAPTSKLPTFLLAITADSLSADELAARLRGADTPIVTRVDEGRVLVDLRTVFEAEEAEVVNALERTK
jgi:L-seryl-tRNA(Ser) seleniumtransferase